MNSMEKEEELMRMRKQGDRRRYAPEAAGLLQSRGWRRAGGRLTPTRGVTTSRVAGGARCSDPPCGGQAGDIPDLATALPEAGTVVLIALGMDLLGEPPAFVHPVVWYGTLIGRLQQAAPRGRVPQLLYGVVMLLLAAPMAFLPAVVVHQVAKRARAAAVQHGYNASGFLLSALIEGMALKPLFALRMLIDAGRSVRMSLEQGNLPAARHALQSLVSRDRSQLTPELAAAAAIESLAENLSDSVVAPLCYYALLGLPGAALYRLFNTFDSMIGYRGQYEYLGKAAARLDDVLNIVPSRLTALLIIALAPLFGGQWRRAWHIWRRDARQTASPNAGHPMAAAAGALGVQLEKVGHYRLGDNERAITARDVQQAEQMVWWIGGGVVFLTALCKTFWRKA